MIRIQVAVCAAWLAVAGSPAAADDNDPVDPTTILDRTAFATTGQTRLGDVLQRLPQHGNATNDQINDAGDGTSPVSLRGLGTIRTLTLINGRRSVAGGFNVDASVDPDSIPLAAIDHVEILQGDGSALYGSSAVAGVVNLVTHSEFSGAEGTTYAAITPHGDARILAASTIVGYRTESRMFSVMVAADVERQDPVLAGDRGFSRQPMAYDYGAQLPVLGGSVASTAGRIDTANLGPNHGPLNLCGDGVRYCTSNGAGGYRPFETPGDLYNYASSSYLVGSSRRISVFGASALHLSWGTAFVEASYLDRSNHHQLAPEPFSSATYGLATSRDSVYNPLGTDVTSFDRRLEELGPRPLRWDATIARLAAGVRGAIPDDAPAFAGWAWQLSYDHGHSDTSYHLATANLTSLGNAIGPSFFDPVQGPTCGAPRAVVFGCVPINLLGPAGSLDAAARNYLMMTIGDGQSDELHTAQASAHGRLVALAHGGSLSLAFGGELRDESGGERRLSDVGPLPVNGVVSSAPSTGAARALEAYGQLSLVTLRDLPPFRSVEVDLAARAFRSDLEMSFQHDPRVNGVDWKASAAARTVAGVALRAAYSRSQRLTTLGERLDFLFANPLAPERARLFTAGVVTAPPALPRFVTSVDYWNIAIRNDPVTGRSATAIPSCFVHGLESACQRVGRDTSGVDLGASYQHALAPGLGWLREQLDAQYLLKYDIGDAGRVIHGRGNYDLGVHPTVKANLSAAWHDAHAAGGARLRYIGGFHECNLDGCNAGQPARDVDAFYQLDAYASYTLRGAGATTLVIGVDNLLDRSPPMIYGGRDANSDGATYDFLGRLLYARLSQSF